MKKLILKGLMVLVLVSGCSSNPTQEEAIRLKTDGIQMVKEEKYQDAVWRLEQASITLTKDLDVYWNLAQCYEQLERYPKAVESWQKYMFCANPADEKTSEAQRRLLIDKQKTKNKYHGDLRS